MTPDELRARADAADPPDPEYWPSTMAERDALAARLAEAERQRDEAREESYWASQTIHVLEERVAALTEALRHYAAEGNDAHDIGCLRNPMHWPDSRDGQPGYERETGGRDAPCSCDFAVARAALAAADRPEGTTPGGDDAMQKTSTGRSA